MQFTARKGEGGELPNQGGMEKTVEDNSGGFICPTSSLGQAFRT